MARSPILIFKGNSDNCYGIMRSFGEQLRDAFISLGEEVIYLDPDDDFITGYADRDYKAVIAFMDTIYDNNLPGTETPLFDLFRGPKFNYWSDHPSVFYHQFDKTPKDYYILTEDINYVDFINRYYDKAFAFFLPPGGKEVQETIPFDEREFDVCFAGTYKNWKAPLENMAFNSETSIRLRDTYLDILIRESDLTTEDAFLKALDSIGCRLGEQEYLGLLNQMHWLADGVVSALFRERLVETILAEEIYLDVFGESWYSSPFCDYPYLRIHPRVDSGDLSKVYSRSKISINMMTWHKNSMTERVLDAMCAGSIVITDRTDILEKSFIAGEDILYYSLSDLSVVPSIIRDNINNDKMARNGQDKALKSHLWVNRAQKLCEIIDAIERGDCERER